jgi:hypothetical protein
MTIMNRFLTHLTRKEIKLQKLMILFYLILPKPSALMGLQDRITNQELVILLAFSFSLMVGHGVLATTNKTLFETVYVGLKGLLEVP